MSVRVVARIRPLLSNEFEKDVIVARATGEDGRPIDMVKIPNPRNEVEEFTFAFNSVYDMGITQEELFTNEVAPTLKPLFQGLDVTIFAYGVTGTGKTHTMRGGLRLSDRGVIPRLLSGVYRRARKVMKDSNGETEVSVTLSYYEIYNDKVFDLFEPVDKRTPSGLPLREKDGKTIVVGLSERPCDDLKDFERLYIEANNNRSTAGTKLNAQSSRSHAILMVKLAQTTGDQTRVSTASAIDLAGSEDNRRTENGKERMVESASINKSLFVLSQCIDAIGRGDKRVPYRESKMTRILSLGQNNGKTIMILNLAPLRCYHLDTLSSLNVSSRAKRIEVREIENEVVFKQPPRANSAFSGASIQRQPLRALANAHNMIPNVAGSKATDKPAKAFSVYSDKSRMTTHKPTSAMNCSVICTSSSKRPSDTLLKGRTSKLVKSTTVTQSTEPGLSAVKIEAMVERKVAEILAAKAQNDQNPVAGAERLSDAVQRRLEALERKIESNGQQEDSRNEGLRYLLMAKQHKERGEDSSALKMYELAQPFFPEQEKLQRKIDNLKNKIAAKRNQERLAVDPSPQTLAAMSQYCAPSISNAALQTTILKETKMQSRGTAAGQVEAQAGTHKSEDRGEDSHHRNAQGLESRVMKGTLAFSHEAAALTPRSRHLLSVINSRDLVLIRGLSGVGAKKARDLVEFLELQGEEDGGRIASLEELVGVPGLGQKTVERMYDGLVA